MSSRTVRPSAVGANRAEEALRELVRVQSLLRRALESRLVRFGLGLAQWSVLRTLQRLEAGGAPPPRVTELCAHLLIRPPSVSGVVERLERLGLIEKLDSAADQRFRHVRLTAAGRRRVEAVLAVHGEWIATLGAGLTRAEHVRLAGLLARLAAGFAPERAPVAPRMRRRTTRASARTRATTRVRAATGGGR